MGKTYLVFLISYSLIYLSGCSGKEAVGTPGKPSGTTTVFEKAKVIPNAFGGYVDGVGPIRVSSNDVVHIAGWAADPREVLPVKTVIVVADGRQVSFSPLTMGLRRPDVADSIKNSNLIKSGWHGLLPASALGKGKHRLEAYAVLDNGNLINLYYKDEGNSFEIEVVD